MINASLYQPSPDRPMSYYLKDQNYSLMIICFLHFAGNAKFLSKPRFDQSANATRMRIAGDRPLHMQVYDIHGNKVHEFTHEGAESDIHLTNYQPGTYRVHVKTTNGPSAMADFTVPVSV